jgi:hypothetical protein
LTLLVKQENAGKQIAGYDLGGTDKARPEGGEIFFDRRLPGLIVTQNGNQHQSQQVFRTY